MRTSTVVTAAVVSGIGLLLAGLSAQAADAPAPRARWEYKILTTVQLVEVAKDDNAFKKAVTEANKHPAPGGFSAEKVLAPEFALNKLGDDGWELIAVVPEQLSNDKADEFGSLIKRDSVYYLRRPK
jgi:hypothetical protein